jgi:hypothetical protein
MSSMDEAVIAIQRMNRLLALVATKGEDTKDAVLLLSRSGHTQNEIAALLGMKPSAVSMTVLRYRRGGTSTKGKASAKARRE